MPTDLICAHPDCTNPVGRYGRKYCSIACSNRNRGPDLDMARIIEMRAAGYGVTNIGKALGVTGGTIRDALIRAGQPTVLAVKPYREPLKPNATCEHCNTPFRRDSADQLYCSKLCGAWGRAGWVPMDEVHRMLNAGRKIGAIARKLNIPRQRIQSALRREEQARQQAEQTAKEDAA